MTRLMVRHKVKDYATWRAGYDEFGPIRDSMGTLEQAVYMNVDDPLDITVTHDFATTEAAKAFANSAELKEAMQKAGVDGAPDIWFVDPA